MEINSPPRHVPNAQFVVLTATFQVPVNQRLHVTHVWSAAGGSIVVDVMEQDAKSPIAPRTLISGAGTLSGLDTWVLGGNHVTVAGTAGFHGWLEPAIP